MSLEARLLAPERRAKVELTGLDKFSEFAFKLFGKQGRRLAELFPSLGDEIRKSDMRITPEGLASVALLVTMITGIATGALAAVGVLIGFYILVAPVAFLPCRARNDVVYGGDDRID